MILPASLARLGFFLRPCHANDLPFLRELYGEGRAGELADVAWPDDAKRAFLDDQFSLQHRHYLAHFAAADFLILEHAGLSIGRLYLLRAQPRFQLIDIALLPDWCGKGIGSKLIHAAQARSHTDGADGVDLHADMRNVPAQRLYERLGFRTVAQEGAHFRMQWDGPAIPVN